MLTIIGCLSCLLSVKLHIKISKMRDKKEILVKFGEKIREKRIQKGLSQEELAHIADVHRTYIGMIERAERNITLLSMEKFAKALDTEIIELLS